MNIVRKYKYLLIIMSLLTIVIIYFYLDQKSIEQYDDEEHSQIEMVSATNEEKKIFVDIKGAVKKPGVYEVAKGEVVNDVITKAGGLLKTASTKNINLSKKVTDEMVIYIFTSNELKKQNIQAITDATCKTEIIEVNNCVETTTTVKHPQSGLININTATLEELNTISGIGESKAKAIISYREKQPFEKIEDIMNVSGIGESVFAKIKDLITV